MTGTELARKALEQLLTRAENATSRGSLALPSLRISESSFPGYQALRAHADRVDCNASWQLAERAGAVRIDWDARAGERQAVERLTVADAAALARHLGLTPRWVQVGSARELLAPHLADFPVLAAVLEAWDQGKVVRGTRASDLRSWLDAVLVAKHCAAQAATDTPIRRLSVSLFSDSKRIEALAPQLDVLTHGETGGLPRVPEDVFQELGLVRFPPTLLIAADAFIDYGEGRVDLPRPYLGLAPTSVTGISTEAGYLLTIENLTTFHEAVLQRPAGAMVLYTGGMPSPSWVRVYRLALRALPPDRPAYHWGDIDVGGLRIANHLAKACQLEGRALQLHAMGARPAGAVRRELTAPERSEIERICRQQAWSAEIEALGTHAIEQEGQPINWPQMRTTTS